MEENITIEFVKEWIDMHKLSKGSFDRIMSDLIYNSGHYYIDNPSLRYWLIDNTYKFRDMLPVELNENQQIVFGHLVNECLENDLTYALWQFTDDVYEEPAMSVELSPHIRAWKELSDRERLQVLAAVMEKGLKEVEE